MSVTSRPAGGSPPGKSTSGLLLLMLVSPSVAMISRPGRPSRGFAFARSPGYAPGPVLDDPVLDDLAWRNVFDHGLLSRKGSALGGVPADAGPCGGHPVASAGRHDQPGPPVRGSRRRRVPGLADLRRTRPDGQVAGPDGHLSRPLRDPGAGRAGSRGA